MCCVRQPFWILLVHHRIWQPTSKERHTGFQISRIITLDKKGIKKLLNIFFIFRHKNILRVLMWMALLILPNEYMPPPFANSVDPDQLASKKPTDLDLHCLSWSMCICINTLDQVIWLADHWKWVWHLNLFSMTRVHEGHSNGCTTNHIFSWRNRKKYQYFFVHWKQISSKAIKYSYLYKLW